MPAFTEWETPQDFYDALDAEFHFETDICAVESNKKSISYYDPGDNALEMHWRGICWMNPPYDRDIGLWMEKAWISAHFCGATVVCLIQGRSTDTKWWHDYVMKASEVRYIKNRLHFGKHGVFTRANISNVVVVFRPLCTGPPTTMSIDTLGRKIN